VHHRQRRLDRRLLQMAQPERRDAVHSSPFGGWIIEPHLRQLGTDPSARADSAKPMSCGVAITREAFWSNMKYIGQEQKDEAMRKPVFLTFCLLLAGVVEASAQGIDYVRPSIRRDGTVTDGHFRTSPNSTRLDNFSTRGNQNPFTGQRGSRPAYPTYSPPRAPSPAYGASSRRR
jgi:hypothetical protein